MKTENSNDLGNEISEVNIPVVDSYFSLFDSNKLEAVKNTLQTGDAQYQASYEKLLRSADKALDEGPFSVMQKTQVAPSGDKHDYLSLAPYWWPDPEKPDGLPWIRKDGEINPMTRGNNVDEPVKDNMMANVRNLSLAYYFSDNVAYASKTKELLVTWFINDNTKMNPNLNYAQGVPGRSEGRGFGIIEFAGISHVITALEILKRNNQLDDTIESGMNKWINDYLDWLQTSELGLFEKSRKNNHATMYDVQIVSLLLYLDRLDEAKKVLENVVESRILAHIEPDGRQPEELERTKALTYSILNLSGLTKLAFLARKKGVEVNLWEFESDNGDLKKAYDYLEPYLEEENIWPYQQLGSMDSAIERLRRMFITAGSMLEIEKYCQSNSEIIEKDHLALLLYPCIP